MSLADLAFTKKPHEYRLSGVRLPGVSEILAGTGLKDSRFFNEEKAGLGTRVHEITALHDIGSLDFGLVDYTVAGCFDAWLRFLRETGFVSQYVETPLYHPTYLYAGTPDRIGKLYGEEAVIDIKTGVVEDWAELQTAGYDEMAKAQGLVKRAKRFVVQLRADGTYRLIPCEDRNDGQTFLSAVAVYRWKLKHGGIDA